MLQKDDCGFYFDKVRIYSTRALELLYKELPIEELIKESCYFDIRRSARIKCQPSLEMYDHVYLIKDPERKYCQSVVELSAPTLRCLKLLWECESSLGGYMVVDVELAWDKYASGVCDAEMKARGIFETIRKKYSFGRTAIYEDDNGNPRKKTKKERAKDRRRGLFASRTWYSVFFEKGSPDHSYLKYVIYPRYTKINFDPSDIDTWMPCVHYEWRIKGSRNIRKITRISTIGEMVSFDFEIFFKTMQDKYITHENLDTWALGLWLADYNDGRRRVCNFGKREMIKIGVMVATFRSCENIHSYSAFRNFVRREQKRIKRKKGFKTLWEQKIMEVKNLKRFALPQ
ncbi:MAG: hypothetical protein K4571_16215 [Deltaproteobacteria bacterium]